ncbi:SHOCT domain-containing protein [Natrarchaeobaculum aegyptiacum]|uniref:SHOCT domain-containing protein n=1 Tax=Natrarchaeobaculum aegyptiacum TaxID=745377 RepID=A0A2Z2HTG6_9EURY|nr:SHOCT domain-containing protein [Natrarchaeobaculum aegyptiacum]ARS88354.1 hypothetical protein B1756_00340 [Natrarchaeobaculum aegyptiacum]
MGSDSGDGRRYSAVELFALKFVLADVVIILVLLLAGPVYAVLVTALFVLSTVLLWYLMGRESSERASEAPATEHEETDSVDPVTTLQERYAAGELTESEFEERLEMLIESNERADDAGIETDDLDLGLERSR